VTPVSVEESGLSGAEYLEAPSPQGYDRITSAMTCISSAQLRGSWATNMVEIGIPEKSVCYIEEKVRTKRRLHTYSKIQRTLIDSNSESDIR
jgi:hypothetical protein